MNGERRTVLINSVHRRCGVHRHGGVVEMDLHVKMKVGRGGVENVDVGVNMEVGEMKENTSGGR